MLENFKNRTFFFGENLNFLRGINSESIDLVATDPPFNKGKDFHATPDSLAAGASFQDRWSWERDVEQSWVDQISDDFPAVREVYESAMVAHSRGLAAFLCFMGVRLIEIRRVLKDTGAIYLHCDPTASHYLKALMDAVFGAENFRNEIVWCYKTGGTSKRWFARKHDVILFYAKGGDYVFNVQEEKSYLTHEYGFSSVGIRKDEEGRPYRMVGMRDYWDIAALRGNQPEHSGYPTQKPLALYRRMILASSNEGDVVLDPFCGCATTCIAAEGLRRRWIGMDIWENTYEIIKTRLRKEGLLQDEKAKSAGELGVASQDITFTEEVPERTDDGLEAVPFLAVKEKTRVLEEKDGLTNAQRKAALVEEHGLVCQGCGFVPEFADYLELDHDMPRVSGGANNLENRILLCGPCNRKKGADLTLHGLRKRVKKEARAHKGFTHLPRIPALKEKMRAYLAQRRAQGRGAAGERGNVDNAARM